MGKKIPCRPAGQYRGDHQLKSAEPEFSHGVLITRSVIPEVEPNLPVLNFRV
jgi:hypothetical protein